LTYALGAKLRERWKNINDRGSITPQVYLVDPPVKIVKKPIVILSAIFFSLRYFLKIPRIWPLAVKQSGFLRRFLFSAFLIYEYRNVIRFYGVNIVFQTQYLGRKEQVNYKYLFDQVQDRLFSYHQSQCVITGRIHVAIPALFSGANVVFVQPNRLDASDVFRVSDHAELFSKRVTLNEADFGGEVIAAICRDVSKNSNSEYLQADLVKRQVKIVSEAVSVFYATSYLH
jgi:hypothetical protein